MREEAQRGDGGDQPFGSPAAKEVQHQVQTAHREQETGRRRDDESDDLVLRQCRHAGADRKKGSGHEEAREIARHNNAVIRIAEDIDGDPDRKRQCERNAAENPRRDELAEHGLVGGDGKRHQVLDGARLPLFGPYAHRDGRDEQQVEPRVIDEERLQIGLAGIEEPAEIEGQRSRQREKDDDEDIGERRAEIAAELPFRDDEDVTHAVLCRSNRPPSCPRRRRPASLALRTSLARIARPIARNRRSPPRSPCRASE